MKKYYSCYWMAAFIFLGACNKFLEVDTPVDKVETQSIFKDAKTAESAIAGLYSNIRTSTTAILNGGLSFYPGAGSDEFYNPTNLSTIQAFYKNDLLPNNATVGSLWTNSYRYIYQINSILEALEKSDALNSEAKEMYRGEMLYMRSLIYFYLINLFGNVPLVLTSDYNTNSTLPAASTNDVYSLITSDLNESIELLAGSVGTLPNTRPGQMAAMALLARVSLYQGKWPRAVETSTAIINSGKYRLETNLNTVFINTSAEIIYQISRPNTNTSEGGAFIPASTTALPAYAVTDYLLNAFSVNDARKLNWLKTNTVAGKTYYYPYKYKIRSSTTSTECNIVHRFAEIYLIRAEAYAHLDNLSSGLNDINIIRKRAGMPDTMVVMTDDLLNLIAIERQRELFAEWGHRWFDLKRTGIISNVLSERKPSGWQDKDSLYPIPAAEIKSNPSLKQNPGYE